METVVAISAVITAIATGVMIWAVYAAPQKALEMQWKLQLRDAAQKRRLDVFRTLMATRGNILHFRHVEALNLIDVDFSDQSEKDIRDAWKIYLDHLMIASAADQEPEEEKRKALRSQWQERRQDLLAELLQKNGCSIRVRVRFHLSKGAGVLSSGAWDRR